MRRGRGEDDRDEDRFTSAKKKPFIFIFTVAWFHFPPLPGVSLIWRSLYFFESLQRMFPLRSLTSKVLRYLQCYNSSYTTIHAFRPGRRTFLPTVDDILIPVSPFRSFHSFLLPSPLYIFTRDPPLLLLYNISVSSDAANVCACVHVFACVCLRVCVPRFRFSPLP